MTRIDTRLTFALLASTALAGPALGQALPTGASVVHGGVAISNPSPTALAIQQSTGTAIVNWQGFSIGQGAQVNITQPSAQSSLLNRVTGATPSTIAGQLTANGRVYLVNPNGIVITRSGTVNTGAFVASSLDISDDDFKAGRRIFTGNGSSAAVVNEGTISVGAGGYAALLGGRVENSGTISVPMGQVGLGSGEQIRLDLSGDGFLQVAVPTAAPSGDRALIENSGRIRAPGGRIEIKAASAREAARNVINVSGVVEARSVSGRNGAIVLGGGEGGRVTVSGRLDASGGRRQARRATKPATGYARGGDITVTGDDIRLAGARIDASGAGGGGTVRIGGDYQGGGTLQRATTTTIDAASTVRADALAQGNGGRVIVWSDRLTTFDGLISARGGPRGGNGGFAEVSGKAVLAYNGTTDLSATNGTFGTLLLDPYNVTISDGPNTPTNGQAPGTLATPIGLISGTQFTPNADDSNINRFTLLAALATANVIVTTGTDGAQAGNITVSAPLAWSAPTSLALSAAGSIFVNAPVSAAAGDFGLQAGNGVFVNAPVSLAAGDFGIQAGVNVALNSAISVAGGFGLSVGGTGIPGLPAIGTITATGAVNVGAFVLARGNWVQVADPLPAFSAALFTVTPTTASFLRAQGGAGTPANPYVITDVFGLQGIGTSAALLAGSYALGGGIAAAGTASWNGGAGFVPIGTAATPFSGTLDGRGQTISGLVINRPTTTSVGLFGYTSGTISNVQFAGATVTGGSTAGILAGTVVGGSISGSAAAGAISASSDVGGLVGINNGAITGSTSSATVSGSTDVGGLVGTNNGTVTNGAASGVVTGSLFDIGGLIGSNFGTVTGSSATGAVSGAGFDMGGLIGHNYAGSVTNSFATGSVASSGATAGSIGGLVGINEATISVAYATGNVSGGTGSSGVGGLVGTNSGTIADTFALGAVTGGSAVGGLVGLLSSGIVATSYAAGPVTSPNPAGGLIGAGTTGTVTSSYWDTQRTGQATSAGGAGATGLSTFALESGLPAGFSAAVWTPGIAGQRYPVLTALPVPPGANVPSTPPENVILATAVTQPTLSRTFGQTTIPVFGNTTTIELVGLGGAGGPTLGAGGGAGGPSLGTDGNSRAGATETLAAVQRFSNNLEQRLAQCERESGRGGYQGCVGDALEQFANEIDTRSLTLPAPLRNVTAVIREAARGVRAAPTIAAARAVVRTAVAEVRKAIALIRADDRAVGRLQVRQGNVIASALRSVDSKLSRAVGL